MPGMHDQFFFEGNSRERSVAAASTLRALFAIALLFFQVACSSSIAMAPPLPTPTNSAYQLAAGDEVKISIYGFDPLGGTYLVNDQGGISLPLAGQVTVSGKSIAEAEAAIASVLVERQVAINPSVNVQIVKYRPFFVLGEVQRPGSYPYMPGMSLLNAVSIAGGYTFRADRKTYGISRTIDGKVVKGSADEETIVQPGDTVIVYEAWF